MDYGFVFDNCSVYKLLDICFYLFMRIYNYLFKKILLNICYLLYNVLGILFKYKNKFDRVIV